MSSQKNNIQIISFTSNDMSLNTNNILKRTIFVLTFNMFCDIRLLRDHYLMVIHTASPRSFASTIFFFRR